MSHPHFAAWGVIDIESMERMQRRHFIRKCREYLAEHHMKLHCGGQKRFLDYAVLDDKDTRLAQASGERAFQVVMQRAIDIIEGRSEEKK